MEPHRPSENNLPPAPTAPGSGAAWLRLFFSRQGHDGPPAPHFDGRRFRNEGSVPPRGFSDFLRWRWQRLFRAAPPAESAAGIDRSTGPAPPHRVEGQALRMTWINHSTVLLQTAGINLLTDPIWSECAGPTPRIGSKRRRGPGLRFTDLPPIDVVLVSHNHYDHLDLPSLRALGRRHAPLFFTGLGNAALLRSEGIGAVVELDWWEEAPLPGGLTLTSVPARHFSSRGLRDRNRTLWCGFVIAGPGGSIYFAADTGYGDHFAEIARRFGPPRLALLPIGAYLPRWFMQPVHMAPDEAVRAHGVLHPGTSAAIHFDTFTLADDAPGQAVRELTRAIGAAGPEAQSFRVPDFGAGWDLP